MVKLTEIEDEKANCRNLQKLLLQIANNLSNKSHPLGQKEHC